MQCPDGDPLSTGDFPQPANSSVTTAEIDQATADAQCRRLVGLERIMFDAETRVQNQLLQDSPFAQTFQSQVEAAVQRAKAYDPLD